MKLLKKKYPKVDFDNLTEKDVIYFCRDSLYKNHYINNKELTEKYEEEILDIIKSRSNWDWFYEDIDKNIILTYPVYFNAFSIVDYLLSENIYDIKNYNKDISNALCSCIMLTGEDMMKKIIEYNIHISYIDDMVIQSYQMTTRVMPSAKDSYLDKATFLMKNCSDFSTILYQFISNPEQSSCLEESLFHFFNHYPSALRDKNNIIRNMFSEQTNKMFNRKETKKIIDRWLLKDCLENTLDDNKIINKIHKI